MRSIAVPDLIVISPILLLLGMYFLNKIRISRKTMVEHAVLPIGERAVKANITVKRYELQEHYAAMSDERLIELWSSSLTDIGRECATEELALRDRAPLDIEAAPIDPALVVRQNVTVSLIKEDNRASLQFAFLGIGLSFVGILIRSGLTFFFGWMLLSGAVAYYAKAKGRSPAWSLPSFFLSPVIGVLVVACLPARPRFTCSGCDRAQAKDDRICAGCGKAVVAFAGSVGSIEAFIYRCPACGAAVSPKTAKCPECCVLLKCKA